MKKLLIVMLAVLMIVFVGCEKADDDRDDKKNTDKTEDNYTEELREILENSRALPMEDFIGNVEVEAFIKGCRLPKGLSCINSNQTRSKKNWAIVREDKKIYEDATGEFVYVFFDFETTTTSYVIDCPYVNIENGTLSVNVSLTLEGNVADNAMGEYTVVLKIEKASFEGDISQFDIKIGAGITEVKLADMLKDEDIVKLDMEGYSGETVVEAFLADKLLPSSVSCVGSYTETGSDIITSNIVVFNESELFADAYGYYAYVFFDIYSETLDIDDCIDVSFDGTSATVTLLDKKIEIISGVPGEDSRSDNMTVVLKVKNTAFKEIRRLKIKTSQKYAEDMTVSREQKLKLIIEKAGSSKLPMENFSGNVTAEAFITSRRLPKLLSCINPEQHRYHKTEAVVCKDKEIYEDATGEFVYVFFDFETTTTSYIIDCPYVNIENGALSVQISLTLEGNAFDTAMGEYTVVLKIAKASFEGDIETVDIVIGN